MNSKTNIAYEREREVDKSDNLSYPAADLKPEIYKTETKKQDETPFEIECGRCPGTF